MNMPLQAPSSGDQRHLRLCAIGVFVFMFVLAMVPGIRTVSGLHWGPEVDFYRDGSFVHGMLEGHYGEDPLYKNEHLWYTPLVFGIEALVVKVTGLPVEETLTRAGAWLNALAPITFFIMVWYFFDALVAVVASAVYLFFLIGQEPAWTVATYSPWLIPATFFQTFFFVQLILIDRACRSDRWGPSLAAGAWAGIIFTGHAAPALISVVMIAFLTLGTMIKAWRNDDRPKAWRRLWLSGGAGAFFIIASLPLTWYVVGHYGMKVVNRAPFQYTYYALAFRNVGYFLYHNINIVSALGVIGLVMILRNKMERGRRMLLLWIGVSILLFMYAYCVAYVEDHDGIRLPGTVPSFHFYFYLKGAMAVLAGVAAVRVAVWLISLVPMKNGTDPLARHRLATLMMLGAVVLAVSAHYPAYAHRVDLFSFRLRSLARDRQATGTEVAQWITTHLSWNDVILCNEDLSIWPVMPTARKMVATANTMANPYVDRVPRERDRDRLLQALSVNDPGAGAVLDAYSVTHVLLPATEQVDTTEQQRWFPVEVFHNADYVIYARDREGVGIVAH